MVMDKFTVLASEAGISPYCIVTSVTAEGLKAFLEAGRDGSFNDEHPWLMAAEMLAEAQAAGQQLPLILAVDDRGEYQLDHWAWIEHIDVDEIRKGRWLTHCRFSGLAPVNPIFTALDSLFLKPGDDQLRRESLEPIRILRQALDLKHLHPYAICETPAFLQARGASVSEASSEG
jgi:hypothetical protein